MSEPDRRCSTDEQPCGTARAIHLLCYALLGMVLAYVLVARWMLPLVFDESVDVRPPPGDQVQQQIDPNKADWRELATLPDIGEVTARRIVSYRQEHAQKAGPGSLSIVFRSLDDLDAIKGIGPKTLAKIAPYLRFPNPPGSQAH